MLDRIETAQLNLYARHHHACDERARTMHDRLSIINEKGAWFAREKNATAVLSDRHTGRAMIASFDDQTRSPESAL